MSHPRELLSALLDGELPPEERLRVEQHMAACPDCADELRELGLVDEWAKHDEVEAPDGYFEALPGRVRTRLRKTAPAPLRAYRFVPQWAWAAAALVLVGLLIPITWSRRASQAPESRVATAPLSENAQAPARVPLAEPPAPPAAPELAKQAPREADQAAPVQAAPGKSAAPPAGFAAPPAAAPVSPKGADDEPRDSLKALGYLDESKQDGDRRARAPEPAAAAESEGGRLAAREETRQQERAPQAAGGIAPGTTSTGAFADQDKRVGADTRGDADSAALGAKRKLEAAPAPDTFAALVARTPRSASEARALRLAWRAFAEAHPNDARADEARVRAIEAAALAARLSGEPADREILEQDAATYLKRPDARQKSRVSALLRVTLT